MVKEPSFIALQSSNSQNLVAAATGAGAGVDSAMQVESGSTTSVQEEHGSDARLHAGAGASAVPHNSAAALSTSVDTSAHRIAEWINSETRSDVLQCTQRDIAVFGSEEAATAATGAGLPCQLDKPLYEAGKDRGGSSIGGPYWTDFRSLKALAEQQQQQQTVPWPWIQVVGHTAEPGSIRFTRGLAAICIDGGLQYGGKTYLEITSGGKFISHVLAGSGQNEEDDEEVYNGGSDSGSGSGSGSSGGAGMDSSGKDGNEKGVVKSDEVWLATDLTAKVCPVKRENR
jgi:hypothetical protein